MPISGFQGVLCGFLVGIKQIMPDQELAILKLKAKVQVLQLPIDLERHLQTLISLKLNCALTSVVIAV